MKTTKLVCSIAVGIVVLCSVHVPKASAQLLSNKWFKMNFAGKGFVVDRITGEPTKATFSLPAYMQFLSTSNAPTFYVYNMKLWTETDAGWTNAWSIAKGTTSTNNSTFFSDCFISVLGMHGNVVAGFHTPHIVIKTGKSGAYKSATYQGIGEIAGGTIPEGGLTNQFYGYFSLTGSTIETNKLPFTPH
jgi:hypothetical protein